MTTFIRCQQFTEAPNPALSVVAREYIDDVRKTTRIAIRVGDQTTGACYTLTDVAGEGRNFNKNPPQYALALENWARKPDAAKYHPKWVYRL